MNYISKDEFLKQPKKIQEILIEYINEKDEPHLYLSNTGEERYGYNTYDIPLLTESQLRKYIEEKICNSKITTEYYLEGYKIFLLDANNDEKSLRDFETNEINLLKAYWKVVTEIASEQDEVKGLFCISENIWVPCTEQFGATSYELAPKLKINFKSKDNIIIEKICKRFEEERFSFTELENHYCVSFVGRDREEQLDKAREIIDEECEKYYGEDWKK